MIRIDRYERRILSKAFPNAYLKPTKHGAYIEADPKVMELYSRLRNPRPRKQAKK